MSRPAERSEPGRMATVRPEMVLMRRGLHDRIARARLVAARATPWPFAVRMAVFAAALAAQACAYPAEVLVGAAGVVLVFVAALPALWPRSFAVSLFWLFTVVGWIASSTVFGGVVTLSRLIGLTVALYAVHSGAALAAALPYDAVVDPAVVARWVLRAAGVLVVSLGASVAAMFWATGLQPRTYLVATLVGLAATAALAWVLARVVRR